MGRAKSKPKSDPTVPPNGAEEKKTEAPKVDDGTVFTGEMLRSIREERGISLQEIAQRTKISVATLKALEEERYEEMPNARVYVRGFIRCLAHEIGLDLDRVSDSYLPRWEAWLGMQSPSY